MNLSSLRLHLGYWATYPWRAWSNVLDRTAGRAAAVVLFYHRVADECSTSWTLSNRDFAAQVAWLRRHFDLVSLDEAQRRLRSRCNRRVCVSITFDDGYAENCHAALPLLIEKRIPCTYFVAGYHVLHQKPFAHDEAAGHRFAPNTLEQLRAMAASGVEIGWHTYSHADLGRPMPRRKLEYELVGARRLFEDLLGRPIRHFAFPFGQRCNLTAAAFHLARDAGYQSVCSAYGGYNFPGEDVFHLQRTAGECEMIRLKNRATVDPRKRSMVRFPWQEDLAADPLPTPSPLAAS